MHLEAHFNSKKNSIQWTSYFFMFFFQIEIMMFQLNKNWLFIRLLISQKLNIEIRTFCFNQFVYIVCVLTVWFSLRHFKTTLALWAQSDFHIIKIAILFKITLVLLLLLLLSSSLPDFKIWFTGFKFYV